MKPDPSIKTKLHSLDVFSSLEQCYPIDLSTEMEMVCSPAVSYRSH